jgi:hypothetical protein
MKKTIRYTLLTGCAIGVLAITHKLAAADDTTSSTSMSCCSGMAMATPTAETSTNATPDLLATCPVSGEKLDGAMGKPLMFVYQDQQVKLCCKSCKKDFDKDPAKYIGKIRAADKK